MKKKEEKKKKKTLDVGLNLLGKLFLQNRIFTKEQVLLGKAKV